MRSLFALVLAGCVVPTAAAGPKELELFEKKIRPVLVEHCYSCHSVASKKQRGGLLLDTRDAVLKGGDTGPALIPGEPAKSLLLQALRYHGDLKMPPKGKLPAAVVADVEQWIRSGAEDPRGGSVAVKTEAPAVEQGRSFWAYRPVQKPALPHVKDGGWGRGDIDAFILAALEAKRARPAPDAAPRVLVRRLYFDLVGLPPTPEEIDAFEQAAARDMDAALIETVDRLLASPHYGERWGRHWLDVARYADSLTLRGFVLKEAWRYRDYVIDAFNDDLPYDRFVREQLAGDLLPAANPVEQRRQMTGVGFLTLGNNNLEQQDKKLLRMDVVDEQLETLGRAFLAQTIGCARCHDHKFDPIPTHDYYALAGILRNTKTIDTSTNVAKWLEMPLPTVGGPSPDVAAHERQAAQLKKQIDSLRAALGTATTVKVGKNMSVDPKSLPGIVIDDTQAMRVGAWMESNHTGSYVGAGYLHDLNAGQGDKTLTYQALLPHSGKYEVRFSYSAGKGRAAAVQVTVFSEEGEKTVLVDERDKPPIDGLFVSLGQYRFEKTGQSYVTVSNEDAKGHVTADAVVFIPVEKLADLAPVAPVPAPGPKDGAAQLKKLEAEMKKLMENAPQREMVMGVVEEAKIDDLRLHIRGSVHNLGTVVPRGFLQVATVKAPPLSKKESGRRELAEWVADPANPLTARVMANRVWCWLTGDGIVRTVDNFGSTGEMPSHPELLDYLAARFALEGWSVKKLVRSIVLSRTYRQASGPALPGDPENRLFARMNRRRLDAECIRDAMLATSGLLQLQRGGPLFKNVASDYNYKHTDVRRSVYAPVFRNALPDLFDAFDFADPSVSIGKRNASTVAPQALFMMNNPFVLQSAQSAAQRLLSVKDMSDTARIERAFRLMLGRAPSVSELRLAEEYIAEAPAPDRDNAWARLVQNLCASIDFRFVN